MKDDTQAHRMRRVTHMAAVMTCQALPDASFARRTTHTMDRLRKEREKGSFPVREMTYFLDGSPDITALKVRFRKIRVMDKHIRRLRSVSVPGSVFETISRSPCCACMLGAGDDDGAAGGQPCVRGR